MDIFSVQVRTGVVLKGTIVKVKDQSKRNEDTRRGAGNETNITENVKKTENLYI